MDGWVGERIGGDSSGEMGRLDSETAQGKARGLACLPRPRFTAGECLLQTPWTGGLRILHGERGSSSGGLKSERSHSLLGWFSTDFTELKPPRPNLPPLERLGCFPQSQALSCQGEHRPDPPRENPSVGVVPARPPSPAKNRSVGVHPAPLEPSPPWCPH